MTAVPASTPVTTPLDDPIVATAVVLLIHVPPAIASVKLVVDPVQTSSEPAIAAGNGFTVKTAVALQPVESVYAIVDVPASKPVATPLDDPIVATVVVPLVHVPPAVASVKLVVNPAQTLSV